MRPKRYLRILAGVGILVIAATGPAQAQFGGGTGEPNDPYQIWTAEQMNAIGADPNVWDKHFILMADIDLSAYDAEAFNTIGEPGARSGSMPFGGVFGSNGHTIANFRKLWRGQGPAGLFRCADGPDVEIKDLTLIDPILDAHVGDQVGALAGRLSYGARISNCQIEDGVILGTDGVGALVGECNYSSITGCHATGTVVGDDCVGGLVGVTSGVAAGIWRCYAETTVVGNAFVGGLIGDGSATNCSASSLVIANRDAGGLAGRGDSLRDCYATSTICANNFVGGLAGGAGRIQNCYAASTISVNPPGGEDAFVGGMIGLSRGLISNCYASTTAVGHDRAGGLMGTSDGGKVANCLSTSLVVGGGTAGGFIGYRMEQPEPFDCFWDIETSGQATSAGGLGLTTAEMQTARPFLDAGWDFVGESDNGVADIWWMPEQDYPRLWWELGQVP